MHTLLKQKRAWWVVLLGGLLALAACAPAQPEGVQVGAPAPDFSLPTASGETVALADYAGQPVLLYFHMAIG